MRRLRYRQPSLFHMSTSLLVTTAASSGIKMRRRRVTGVSAPRARAGARFARRAEHHAHEDEDRADAGGRVRDVRPVVAAAVRRRPAPAVHGVRRDDGRRAAGAQEVRAAGRPVARRGQQRRKPVHLLLLQRQLPLGRPRSPVPGAAEQRCCCSSGG